MKDSFSKVFEEILTYVYPKNLYCICCGDIIQKDHIHGICDACIKEIEWDPKDPFVNLRDSFSFDEVWPCTKYGYYSRQIVLGIKAEGKDYGISGIGKLLAERLEKPGLIVAVPMHPDNEKIRGFNQAELLAKAVSKETGLMHLPGVLVKNRPTESMKSLGGEARKNELSDVFSFNEEYKDMIKGEDIILVDDVVTTGNTADACSKVLKERGAKNIYVLCFAAGSAKKENT